MLHFISVLRAREGSWSAVINQFGAAPRGRQRSTGDSTDKKVILWIGIILQLAKNLIPTIEHAKKMNDPLNQFTQKIVAMSTKTNVKKTG